MSRKRIQTQRGYSYDRVDRVGTLIQRELASIVRYELRDPRIDTTNLCVDEVRVSRDLGFANVYVSSLDVDEEQDRTTLIALLTGAAGYLRSTLAKRLQMYTIPKLRFRFDTVRDQGNHMDALIDRAQARDTQQHG